MLKSKMPDSVLMVDTPVHLARRFHILRELKSIISWPPGAPRRRRELPAIAGYLIPLPRDWFEVWGLSGCVGLCQFGYVFTMALTRRAVEHVLIQMSFGIPPRRPPLRATVGENMGLLLTGQHRKEGIRFLSLSLDLIAVREYYFDEARSSGLDLFWQIVVTPIRNFFGASFSRLVGDSHNVICVNEFVRCNID
jgi:hypothetical protein